MFLTHLSLTNFRNFARLDVDVPKGAVLLIGSNAQGKTSLLEAIYYLAAFVSFHAGSDRELINFISSREALAVSRIVADFCRQDSSTAVSGKLVSHRLEVRIIQESQGFNGSPRLRKEVLLDGARYKVHDVVGQFNAVLFLPQTLRIIEGSPEERRRYLNLAFAQVWPRYAASLADYARLLTQRNALLKQLGERGGDQEQLSFWDEQLTQSGAYLIHARIHALQELERLAAVYHHELTHGQEILRLSYEPSYDPLPQPVRQFALPLDAPLDRSGISVGKIQQGFLDSLLKARSEEIARGVTTIGPHRDDLRFLGNGIDLGVYGSRGQARSAVLALKLAEVAWMKTKTGHSPVLLLDEVLAELDLQRRNDLLSHLEDSEQILLTTTDLDLFPPDFVQSASLWRIESGRLSEEGV
jgi:DNA replication and repair protein RecF